MGLKAHQRLIDRPIGVVARTCPWTRLPHRASTRRRGGEAASGGFDDPYNYSTDTWNPTVLGMLLFFVGYVFCVLAFGFSASGLSVLVCCLLLASCPGLPSWFAVFLASKFSFFGVKAIWLPGFFTLAWLPGFFTLVFRLRGFSDS